MSKRRKMLVLLLDIFFLVAFLAIFVVTAFVCYAVAHDPIRRIVIIPAALALALLVETLVVRIVVVISRKVIQ